MSDIKLFRFDQTGAAHEVEAQAPARERVLQRAFEDNLETLIGVRFLVSEHATGMVHLGRIDTLGLDENNAPVIIEYKRSTNDNVISQGLFYLDWLMDHRREFEWLVLEILGGDAARSVDWSEPRLLCIAGDFTRYDKHAVKQIPRSIELLQYRGFQDGLLAIELIHAPAATKPAASRQSQSVTPESLVEAVSATGMPEETESSPYETRSFDYRLHQAKPELRQLFDVTSEALVALGDDIQQKTLKQYRAFRRIKNVACVQLGAKTVTVFLRVDPEAVELAPGFTRSVRGIGHQGTGDLEVTLKHLEDLEKALPLFRLAYASG